MQRRLIRARISDHQDDVVRVAALHGPGRSAEAGLAVGRVRTVNEFADSDWVKEWKAVVDVDDRNGGTLRMPGNPWIFSSSELPAPGAPAFQGEHNEEILGELCMPEDQIRDMQQRNVLLSRR